LQYLWTNRRLEFAAGKESRDRHIHERRLPVSRGGNYKCHKFEMPDPETSAAAIEWLTAELARAHKRLDIINRIKMLNGPARAGNDPALELK
jgi:hypothetical protein